MSNCLLKICFFFCIQIIPAVCQCAYAIGINEYLSTAAKDVSLFFQKELITFLQTSGNRSLMDEVQFRVTVDEFEQDQQEFAIRFKTRGWNQVRDEKKFNDAVLQSHHTQYDMLLHQALKNRCITVIDWLYHSEMTGLYEDLIRLYEDRLNMLKKSAGMSATDPARLSSDLMDTENDLLRLQMEESELKNRLHFINDEIRRNTGAETSISLNTEKIISMENIGRTARDIASAPADENAAVRNARMESDLANARCDLEKSENSAWSTFIETAYDLSEKEDADKAFSIEFGISLPIGAVNRPEMKARKTDSIKAKAEYEMLHQQRKQSIPALADELAHLIHHYDLLRQKKESGSNQSLYKLWQKTEGADPLLLLRLRESMIKGDITAKKLIWMIHGKYIELLDISGKLSEKSLRDHLSDEKEHIFL
ncbi:MAG: hypothetical protein AB7S75_22400 [Desulfococcaceae bacterium]